MSRPSHIIFDLDGTLVDSAPLCSDILNEMLRERGSARSVSSADARCFLTRGGQQIVSALLGQDCGDVESELGDFRARYAARPTPEHCLYPGVRDTIERLANMGIGMGVCSNKPQHLCDKTVQELCLGGAISSIVGSRPGQALKPASDLIYLSIAELGAVADQCLLIGDSEVDFLTAQAAGIPFLFVSYGYAEPGWSVDGVATINRFDELVEFVLSRELTRAA